MRLSFLIGATVAAVVAATTAASADDREDLLGGWMLVSWTANDADGNVTRYPMGEDALGAIIYSPDGRMSAHLARNPATAEEADEGQTGNGVAGSNSIAYGGVLEVDENAGEVHHHVDIASIPGWIGTTLTRTYVLDGDMLTLTTPPGANGGSNVLVWARVAAE